MNATPRPRFDGRRTVNCPIAACPNTRPRTHAMCRSCWAKVPRDLQQAVYRTYRSAPGSAEHLQALEDARAAVEGRDPVELFGDDDA